MKIKGLIFDLDGVITETADLHFLAWKQTLAQLGLEYTEAENQSLKGLNRLDTLKAILKLKNHELTNSDQLEALTTEKNNLYVRFLHEELTEKSVLAGVKDLLEQAKKLNLKMAIASSSLNAPLILEKISLSHYFDFIVDPRTLKKGKPDPEIFIKAAAGLGMLPQECIGLEDAIAGVESIKNANMTAIAITHQSPVDFGIADFVYDELTEFNLSDLISQLETNNN
ncbi:beta-phosphoglucomutase [Mycoplasmoides fastidiosum]|uniref:Beta-phosphoglucomutase n=1 Tax=Mycoplasmoides fastidiosum TaxID=92758 RepID=A0ABU0LYR8_9BACT|nr:beta-phosphoglucomutase [Mycoplasmoides fastidiosum]MDQ0513851.1 beta-phosphoglucomutase [Mycoplasmoides fastidiosum]UUD37734.1 beta-phosphoglucomutase [Mycoplasmoides fastidiosum]